MASTTAPSRLRRLILKIAFVGSHGVRKTTGAFSLAAALRHRGHPTEVLHEVVRSNPLGLNLEATAEAQLWVLLTQVKRELELSPRAGILVTDRSIVDNYAYGLRLWGGDLYGLAPFVRRWGQTYELVVRLLPDVPLEADGVRSTDEAFRDEIERLVDRLLPEYVPHERIRTMRASEVTGETDWGPLIDALVPPG